MVPPPPENIMPTVPKDQETTIHPRKTTSSTTRPAPEQGIKCPRCDSSNTKFCYYNNYSLTQPRHFCKTCRRYWTNGGALRNVPIGGGCRKNKRMKSSSSSSSTTSSTSFSRIPTEFNLGGLNIPPEYNLAALPFPSRLTTNTNTNIPTPNTTAFFNNFSSFGDANVNSVSPTNGFPSNSMVGPWALGPTTQPSLNVHSSIASSIESLSNVNQDLHMKLQQQRLGTMMFAGADDIDSHHNNADGGTAVSINGFQNQHHKLVNPVMFQNLQISRPESLPPGTSVTESAVTPLPPPPPPPPTEWFFGNSSSFPSLNATTSNADEDDAANVNDDNNWSAGLTWGDLQHQQYSALP